MISANTRNLIQAISIDGSVADRYFAVTSEAPRNTVEARISAMPRNGRSARAGAVRFADFFWGEAMEHCPAWRLRRVAGSRLNSGAGIIESGELSQNDNCLSSTRSENRKPICAIVRGGCPHLPHPEERALARVSKDGPGASWFETALKKRLLTMRDRATASAGFAVSVRAGRLCRGPRFPHGRARARRPRHYRRRVPELRLLESRTPKPRASETPARPGAAMRHGHRRLSAAPRPALLRGEGKSSWPNGE